MLPIFFKCSRLSDKDVERRRKKKKKKKKNNEYEVHDSSKESINSIFVHLSMAVKFKQATAILSFGRQMIRSDWKCWLPLF